jgi:hypothetical protein
MRSRKRNRVSNGIAKLIDGLRHSLESSLAGLHRLAMRPTAYY